ncbi:ComEC/Rec2 family competence protein [Gaiella sp.]|uniref:ComEC/Rec2 family competence protein n=1 Tax=Gaiella sp. TaxID=2663207 RepID=UPI003983114C
MTGLRNALDRGWPAVLLATLALGLSTANWLSFPRLAGVVAGVTAIAASFALPASVRLGLAALALGSAGLWWGGLRLHELDRSVLVARIGEPSSARVVVSGTPSRSPFAIRVLAEVRRFDGVAVRERVLLELTAGRAPPQGSVLELRVRPVAPRGPETGFDERGWLERKGIHVVLHASGSWQIVGRRGGIGGVGDRLRTSIARALALGTSSERRSLVTGVVLGADEGIDPDLRDAFKTSGLYHLLAVSGQNIVFIGFGVLGLAYVLGLPRAVGHSLAIVAILAYALAVGWQPSVVRATVAGCLASLAWLLSRPSDRWHTMAVGAVVLLAWTPRSLLEPGFQLSFTAVAAIFLVMPRLRPIYEGYPLPRWLVEVVGISTACGLVTAPILFLQFGTIPLWTVPANALAEPAMPLLLGAGLAAAIIAPVIPPAAVALSWIAGGAAAWIAFSARFIASLPYAQTSSRTLVLALAGTIGVAAALRALPRYRRRAAVVTALAVVPLCAVSWWALHPPPMWSPPAGLRVTFLDVGQGDGILLETPQGAMLVDAGPPEARVDLQLGRMGLTTLTALVTTHAHRDHVGGGPAVLRRLRVGQVVDPMQPGVGSDERELRRTARLLGVPLVPARVGRTYSLGLLHVRILWPDRAGSSGEDPHLHGAVLLVSYGSIDLLLTGDSESDVTRSLPLRQVEVLKVAHHGSADVRLDDLLTTLRPRVAVISVGAHNDYEHPRPETLSTLRGRAGIAVYRTDEHGRVVLESDGRSLTVRTDRPVR